MGGGICAKTNQGPDSAHQLHPSHLPEGMIDSFRRQSAALI